LDPTLLEADYDKSTGALSRRIRTRDRTQALAIHEESKGATASHEEAVQVACAPAGTRRAGSLSLSVHDRTE
jgi:hypothetical protein